jgi:hypothetical protein
MERGTLRFIFYLGIANFAVFFILALYLGGDAINGSVIDGRYFLSSHGRLTEVTQGVFTYSQGHTRSLFVTHPLAMLSAWLRGRQPKQPN